MGVVRSSLTELIGFLNDAITPEEITLDDDSRSEAEEPPGAPVTIKPTALTTVGRSRRDGPILDLELSVWLQCRGPRQLDNLEKLLIAVERHSQYTTAPDTERPGLGFLVRVPVSVRIDEPSGPPVLEPLIAKTVIGRRISGRLLDSQDNGIAHARIRAHSSANAVVSDDSGRFEVLASADELQHFAVTVRGTERQVTATTNTLPVTIRWE
jgi:hypothetical protein